MERRKFLKGAVDWRYWRCFGGHPPLPVVMASHDRCRNLGA